MTVSLTEVVGVQPGGAPRCSKARRSCVDAASIKAPPRELRTACAPVQPNILPTRPHASAPVPRGGSIQVEDNSLGLLAATCQMLQYNSSNSSPFLHPPSRSLSLSPSPSPPSSPAPEDGRILTEQLPDPPSSLVVQENSLRPVAVVQERVLVVAQSCHERVLQPQPPFSGPADPAYPSVAVTDPPVAWPPVALVQSSLQETFIKHVMCDFTPRDPKYLPTLEWATLEQLVLLLQPHAPMEVARLGQNLRQLITEWYKEHPAFRGLSFSKWAKRLKDLHPLAHPRSLSYKFSFQYTPRTTRGADICECDDNEIPGLGSFWCELNTSPKYVTESAKAAFCNTKHFKRKCMRTCGECES